MPGEIASENEKLPIACFLVINHIPDLPAISISSALINSNLDILIGFINEEDLRNLPKSPRIKYLDLRADAISLNLLSEDQEYKSFADDSFFKLVQLKWVLFTKVLDANPGKNLIYSDIDVFWIKDASVPIIESFKQWSDLDILIQDATASPNDLALCMGFVAFRNSTKSREIITTCSKKHAELLKATPRVGDDDIVTDYYKRMGRPANIQLLPQSTFPVGKFLNAFTSKSLFPGLKPEVPFIFHSNFVVGSKKKLLITLILFQNLKLKMPSGLPFVTLGKSRIEILARRILIPIRSRLQSK